MFKIYDIIVNILRVLVGLCTFEKNLNFIRKIKTNRSAQPSTKPKIMSIT